jgi:hypothetical protein
MTLKMASYLCAGRNDSDVPKALQVKVKLSLYMPGEAARVPGSCGSQISRQSAHESCKVVSPKHSRFHPPGNIPGTLVAESTQGPLCGRKD